MTDQSPGRRAVHRRHASPRALVAAVSSLLLAASALPAFAGPLASDSAESALPVSATQLITDASLPVAGDTDLRFAADVEDAIAAKAAPAAPVPESKVQTVLKRAMAMLGTPYRWGGTSPDGFDCSGLVNYVFRTTLGIELPRVSREMANNGEKIDRAGLVAGDLVFFSRRGSRVDHVGIYVGNGEFVHAPRTGKDVMVSKLDEGYWSGKFQQARRVSGLGS